MDCHTIQQKLISHGATLLNGDLSDINNDAMLR